MPYAIKDSAPKKPISEKQREHLIKAREKAAQKKRENKANPPSKSIKTQKDNYDVEDILAQTINSNMNHQEFLSEDIDMPYQINYSDHVNQQIDNHIPSYQKKKAERIISKGVANIKEKREKTKELESQQPTISYDKFGRKIIRVN